MMNNAFPTEIEWHEITPAMVEGKAWSDTAGPFTRLPEHRRGELPEALFTHAESSTGMSLFFNSDSRAVYARWTLAYEQLGEVNFGQNGFSGVDLYCYDPQDRCFRWLACPPHQSIHFPTSEVNLISGLPGKKHRFRLYLPMRNKLLKLEIGLERGSGFEPVAPRPLSEAVVIYGTSIVHGAYSMHSGLGTTQILGRRLKVPTVNLGFSGGAKLEPAMAETLAELNPRCFVVDPFHNLSVGTIEKNGIDFFRILASKRPETPIVVLGAPVNLKAWFLPELMAGQLAIRKALISTVRKVQRKFHHLHYVSGDNFYGRDREVSIDGIHPNDLAFQRMADVLEPKFRKLLKLQ